MKPVTINNESQAIVYDAEVLSGVEDGLFDPCHWVNQGALVGTAPGRGTTQFIDTPFGPAVLRRYLRGGWAAHLSRDRYLYAGSERSRPFREFHLLADMRAAGLRVPAPIAALCDHSGIFYRGALITKQIQPASVLADQLGASDLNWSRLGRELREFHDAGMDHADLNARNILLHDGDSTAWLLDFDRSSFSPGSAVDGRSNLARFRRSLQKLWPAGAPPLESCWQALLGGYHG
jgi:3-deoxy-D-manno-octulosonic acid kinase